MLTYTETLPEIKRFGAVKFFIDRTYAIYENTTNELEKNESGRFKKYLWAEIINIISFIFIILILINHIVSGVILVGAFLFYTQTIDKLTQAFTTLLLGIAYEEENIQLVKELIKFFEIKPLIETKEPINLKVGKKAPEIVFDNVSFKYPGSDKFILKNISFKIQSGERVGLIGINGAGKTTIVKLILRVYDPTSGDITIDGVNLKNIEPNVLYNQFSVLMQDYNTYNSLSVKESFVVSNFNNNSEVNEKRLKSSAKKSRANEFIEKWDKKYEAVLGKDFDGESLSKGQNQKMSLARTFYREAPVMILDEPTAAIDAESEIEIFEELEKISRDISILYISHDMATIKKADRVMLIEDGKIVENGSHDELMAVDGHYARIYNAQLSNLTKSEGFA